MRKLDIARLKDDTDIHAVVDALGLQTEKRGLLTSILCPLHGDRHFGSCYVTEKGFKCFACGASGDMFKLVQACKNIGFREAAEFIAGIGGNSEKYEAGEDGGHWRPATISAEECRAIGLNNASVYAKIAESYFCLPEYSAGSFKSELMPDSVFQEAQRYAVLQLVSHNPMRVLQESNPSEYHTLIRVSAEKTEKKYRLLADKIKDRSLCKSTGEREAVGALAARIGTDAALAELEKLAKEVRRITEKHLQGRSKKQQQQQSSAHVEQTNVGELIAMSNSAFIENGAPF